MRVHLGHAIHGVEVRARLLHQADVLQLYHIAVAERVVRDDVEELLVVIGLEVLRGLLAGDELGAVHIGDGEDGGLEGDGLLTAEILVDEGDDDVAFVLKTGNHVVYVHNEQGERAHDDEAGRDDGHRGEAHQPVAEYALEAGLYEISDTIQFHSCNTRPFRR